MIQTYLFLFLDKIEQDKAFIYIDITYKELLKQQARQWILKFDLIPSSTKWKPWMYSLLRLYFWLNDYQCGDKIPIVRKTQL